MTKFIPTEHKADITSVERVVKNDVAEWPWPVRVTKTPYLQGKMAVQISNPSNNDEESSIYLTIPMLTQILELAEFIEFYDTEEVK